MIKNMAVVCLLTAILLCLTAGVEAQTAKDPLPLRRVTLYNNGVGYFEREGKVSGDEQVNLSFDSAKLNDVLKSPVVLNRNEGSASTGAKISAVSFDSINPIDMRLGELGISLDSTNTAALTVLLGQLKGSRVEVRSGPVPISGTIVGLQKKNNFIGQERIDSQELVLVAEGGELRTVQLDQIRGIKLLDPKLRDDLDRYLSILHSASQQNLRTLTIKESGQGERGLFVSYLTEAPVWKPTYRLILSQNEKPFIQGWAVIDNTQDEDWDNVSLSLVAGKPVSFIQDLQQPRYKRRPVVGIPEDFSPTPQIHAAAIAELPADIAADDESTSQGVSSSSNLSFAGGIAGGGMGSIQGVVTDSSGAVVPGAKIKLKAANNETETTATTNDAGRYVLGGLSPGTYAIQVERSGFKTAHFNVAVAQSAASRRDIVLNAGGLAETITVESNASPLDSVRNPDSGVDADTSSQEVGELFKYSIDHPVTIKRNSSALIPILQTNIEGESESLYNAETLKNYPMSAIYLKNTTGLTLEGGPLTVLENNTYAGDALIGLIKPGDSRFITYAVDLGCRITTDDSQENRSAFMTEILNGAFLVHFHQTRKTVYTINNVSDHAKTIVIEHPREGDGNWTLVGGVEPFEKTEDVYRFKVSVPAHSAKDFAVPEELPQTTSYQLSSLTPDNIDLFVHLNYLSPEMKQSLDSILDIKLKIADLGREIAQKQTAITQIGDDQGRMRENLKALGKSDEERQLVSKYVSKISDSDDRLDQLRKEQQQLQDQQNSLQGQLSEMLKKLALQRKL